MNEQKPRRVVILGAGITGLSAAYELARISLRQRCPLEVVVLEAASRVGGKVLTETYDGISLEAGPDSFLTLRPQALELIRELGLSDELLKTHPTCKTVYACRGGRLEPFPDGSLVPPRLTSFLNSRLLTWRGKLRLALEPFIAAKRDDKDESIGSFVRRRFGAEVLENILGPVLGGIYAGDCDRLSLASTFPQLKAMELQGSLLRAAAKARPRLLGEGATTMFMTLKGGLSKLTEVLAHKLAPGTLRTGAAVNSLFRRGGGWQAESPAGTWTAEAVISALPAWALAGALEGFDPELAGVLREIPFVSTATASLVYQGEGFPALEGFGFVVPRGEGKALTAATFSSTKFPGRVPERAAVIRCFLGGAGREELVEGDEAAIARAARSELRAILGLGERHPKTTRVTRWLKANPQYTVGHAVRLKRIESCLQGHPGLVLAGCSYRGVGLPDCIRSGREAAEKAFRSLTAKSLAGIA